MRFYKRNHFKWNYSLWRDWVFVNKIGMLSYWSFIIVDSALPIVFYRTYHKCLIPFKVVWAPRGYTLFHCTTIFSPPAKILPFHKIRNFCDKIRFLFSVWHYKFVFYLFTLFTTNKTKQDKPPTLHKTIPSGKLSGIKLQPTTTSYSQPIRDTSKDSKITSCHIASMVPRHEQQMNAYPGAEVCCKWLSEPVLTSCLVVFKVQGFCHATKGWLGCLPWVSAYHCPR